MMWRKRNETDGGVQGRLTDDEEQRRMLLHCVEDTRKLYPDFRKSTLAKTH